MAGDSPWRENTMKCFNEVVDFNAAVKCNTGFMRKGRKLHCGDSKVCLHTFGAD